MTFGCTALNPSTGLVREKFQVITAETEDKNISFTLVNQRRCHLLDNGYEGLEKWIGLTSGEPVNTYALYISSHRGEQRLE